MANDFFDRMKNISLLALGAVILAAHVLIFKLDQYFFTVIICLYIIGYTVLVMVLMYKNQRSFTPSDFSTLLNMSLYTLFLELFLIIMTLSFKYYRQVHRY